MLCGTFNFVPHPCRDTAGKVVGAPLPTPAETLRHWHCRRQLTANVQEQLTGAPAPPTPAETAGRSSSLAETAKARSRIWGPQHETETMLCTCAHLSSCNLQMPPSNCPCPTSILIQDGMPLFANACQKSGCAFSVHSQSSVLLPTTRMFCRLAKEDAILCPQMASSRWVRREQHDLVESAMPLSS